MKRAKRLYVLLGVLVVVCAAAFAAVTYQEQKEAIRTSGEVVLEVDPETVQSLSWTYEDETLAFHKDEEETWLYDGDEAFPVDQVRLQTLLEQFQEFRAAFVIEDVTDYAQYGLDDPVCTITLSTGEEDYEITLGDYSTMDSQRYVSTGDGQVYLAVSDPLDYFDASLDDMIDDDETPLFGQVEQIQFDGADSYQVIYQEYTDDSPYTYCSDDVYFKQEGDDLLPLDTARVEGYLSTIEYLSLDEHVAYNATEEDLATYGLDDPELTVTIQHVPEDGDGTAETFTLSISRDPAQRASADGSEDTDEEIIAYARVDQSKIIYQIDETSYEALMAAGYDDLRHTQVLTADLADVTALDISLEGQTYTITSKGSGEDQTFWYGEEELTGDALTNALEGLTASSFTDETPSEKEEISLTVHLDNEVHPQVQIDLYRYDGEQCLAVIDGEPVSLVPRTSVVDLIEAVNAIVL